MTQDFSSTAIPGNRHQRLAGKVALVTGAGTGIGRAAALAYAREGAKLVLAGRRKDEIEHAAQSIVAAGGAALAVVTDVSRQDEVQRLVATALDRHGRLDVAFNNAGVLGRFAPIAEQTGDDFDDVIAINLKGVWLAIKYEVQAFLEQGSGGAIVNTSSWVAQGAIAGTSAYSASKGALEALVRTVALEYGPHGIRINNINPGIIDTPMARGNWSDDAAFVPYIQHTPLRRTGKPDDVGDVAVWLTTDEARFVTGQSILVDGGYTIAGFR